MFGYPGLVESMSKNRHAVDCIIRLQPSDVSQTYKIRILYQGRGYSPKAWMIDPPMEQYDGIDPHHLYGKDKNGHPQLCVFDPDQDNWSCYKSLANVFIPWVITWLYTYEIWLITGEWLYPEGGQVKMNKETKE